MQLRVLFLLLAFLLSHYTYGQSLKPCNTVNSVHNDNRVTVGIVMMIVVVGDDNTRIKWFIRSQ